MIAIRYEEHGPRRRVITVTPSTERLEIEPLGFEDFKAVYLSKSRLPFTIRNARFVIEEGLEKHNDDGTVDFDLGRTPALDYAALLPNGWLPAAMAQVATLVPDANVAGNLGALKEAVSDKKLSLHGLLDLGARKFSPMLALLEGNSQAYPTGHELERRASELTKKFAARFKESAHKLEAQQLRGVSNLIKERQERWPHLADFLKRTWPCLKGVDRSSNLTELSAKLEHARACSGLPIASFAYLIALNAAFTPRQIALKACPGRAITKPGLRPTDKNLYNVACDIWALEVATQLFSVFGEQNAAICTNDHGMIGFWSLVRPRNFAQHPGTQSFTLSLPDAFTPCMPPDLRKSLFDQLGLARPSA